MRKKILFAVLLCASSPSSASGTQQVEPTVPKDDESSFHFESVGNWEVRVDLSLNAGCYAYAQFEDRSIVRLLTDPLNDTVMLAVGNWRWRSLDIEQDYDVQVEFDNLESWQATAGVLQIARVNHLLLSVGKQEFLVEMAASKSMRVEWNGRAIAQLDMSGSGAAIDALVKCQNTVEDVIDDPFAP